MRSWSASDGNRADARKGRFCFRGTDGEAPGFISRMGKQNRQGDKPTCLRDDFNLVEPTRIVPRPCRGRARSSCTRARPTGLFCEILVGIVWPSSHALKGRGFAFSDRQEEQNAIHGGRKMQNRQNYSKFCRLDGCLFGGADQDRTGDLLNAIQTLSQTELRPRWPLEKGVLFIP